LEYEEKKGPSEITLDKRTLYTVSSTTTMKEFFSTLYPKPSPITSLGKKRLNIEQIEDGLAQGDPHDVAQW
jgi:hypothetical protein